MRMRRMLSGGEGYYHVISRITGQQFLMNAEEKDVLMRSMFNVAIFSGVEILTFALMDNHFHLLVKVPRAHEVDEAELLVEQTAPHQRGQEAREGVREDEQGPVEGAPLDARVVEHHRQK